MGHCYLTGTAISALSERKILGGNQHALPLDLFPEDLAYVALGHLHLAQKVGRDDVRYCGSPLALAMDEARYRHQVCLADFEGGALTALRTVTVPRTVPLRRIPERGAVPLDELLPALRALPALREGEPPAYLEVSVALPRPEPLLRTRIDDALRGKSARLLRLTCRLTGHGVALGDVHVGVELRDLTPEQVFERRYARDHQGPPPPLLREAFLELVDGVMRGERS
jgi:exonuclease SbcD